MIPDEKPYLFRSIVIEHGQQQIESFIFQRKGTGCSFLRIEKDLANKSPSDPVTLPGVGVIRRLDIKTVEIPVEPNTITLAEHAIT